jgi:hypothetical protein
MFKIFYSEKDTTLYQFLSGSSTGLDEILEIGKRTVVSSNNSSTSYSRSLIKFDTTEIVSALSKYSISLDSCKFVLQLFTAEAINLPTSFTIDCKLVGQDWRNGTGFLNGTTTDGASWIQPHESWSLDSNIGSLWISSSQDIQINNSSIYVSGSGEGGSWYYQSGSGGFNLNQFNQIYFSQGGLSTNSVTSASPTDISIDVTDAIKLWLSGSGGNSIPNNGFLLKYSEADEADETSTGFIRYFSRDTHTIYVPKLTLYWDNSTFTTGSMTSVNTDSYVVYTSCKPTYKDIEISKIRIYARDKYPQKSPTNLYPIQTVNYLPTTTYYSVLDAATDEVIIPYDDIYTKVSCDSTSNFINIDFSGFMPERYYRLELKIVNGIEEQYITDQIYFKVIR